MPTVRYRAFRSRGVYANIEVFRREVAAGYSRELFPLVRAEAQQFTQGWKVAVDWRQTVRIAREGITHDMRPVGEGAKIWTWLTHGVPGRWIIVRKQYTHRGVGFKYKPAMRMRRYTPYTSPGGFGGGAGGGVAGGGAGYGHGGWAFRFAVWWSGIAARNFEIQIINAIRPAHIKMSENIVRRAIRAAQRRGR